MAYHCRRCKKYSTDTRHHFKSHLGRIDDDHNMGPWVCQVPGCHVRAVRRGSEDPHEGHPGVKSTWAKDEALAEAIDAELAASERPDPLAPSTAGPAGSITAEPAHSTAAEPAPLVYSNTSSPYPPPGFHSWTKGSGDLRPYPEGIPTYPPSPSSLIAAGSGQSTTAPTAAGPSTTASSSTTTAPFAIDPALLAINAANHATPNNHNHGANHDASAQGKKSNHNNNGDGASSTASAPLESSIPTILAHGEDSDITNDSDDSESSREYLIRTGVAPLFMEAMKLLALTDPPVEKPLLWAGKWFEARSREIEGVDEEDGEKEDVKDGGKEKEKEDESEEKENENEGGKEDEKEPEKNDEKDGEKDDEKDVEKNIEKNVEKDDQKDVEVGGEKEAKKEDEHK